MPAPQHRMPNLKQQKSQVSNALKPVEDAVMQVCDEATDLVRENPASSAFVTFAVGVGLGVALVTLLRPARRPPMISHSTWSHIRDAVSQALPDALSRYVHT